MKFSTEYIQSKPGTQQGLLKDIIYKKIYEVPSEFSSSYLPFLDGLRGIAIILVLISHCLRNDTRFDVVGRLGVEIFFVLSGFLITTLLIKERVKNRTISLKMFYIRRALRIMPVAYLFLLVLVVLNVIFKLDVTLISFISSIFYTRNIPFPHATDWYTGHFWSLSIEEQFYLFFPFILAININRYTVLITFLICFLPAIGLLAVHRVSIFYSNPVVHVIVFVLNSILFGSGTVSILVGSLFSILVFKNIIIIKNLWSNYFLTSILFILALFVNYSNSIVFVPHLSRLIFSILIAFIILINLNGKSNLLSIILDNAVLKKIGILSYSIYIWQQLFTFDQPWKNSFKYSNSLLLNLPLLFVVAYVSYFFYEKYFLLLKNKFK